MCSSRLTVTCVAILALALPLVHSAPTNCTEVKKTAAVREAYILRHLLKAISHLICEKNEGSNLVEAIAGPVEDRLGQETVLSPVLPETTTETLVEEPKETPQDPQSTTVDPTTEEPRLGSETPTENCKDEKKNKTTCVEAARSALEQVTSGSDVNPTLAGHSDTDCHKCPADSYFVPVVKFECKSANEMKNYMQKIFKSNQTS